MRYRGTYLVGNIVTRFSLNSQRDKQAGHYLWRGTLSILDSKGFVLQVEGDARRKIEKRLKEREPDYVPGTRREELNAAMALHCQDVEEAEMRAYIARSAVRLCEKHLDAIRMDWARGEKAKNATLLDALSGRCLRQCGASLCCPLPATHESAHPCHGKPLCRRPRERGPGAPRH